MNTTELMAAWAAACCTTLLAAGLASGQEWGPELVLRQSLGLKNPTQNAAAASLPGITKAAELRVREDDPHQDRHVGFLGLDELLEL